MKYFLAIGLALWPLIPWSIVVYIYGKNYERIGTVAFTHVVVMSASTLQTLVFLILFCARKKSKYSAVALVASAIVSFALLGIWLRVKDGL